MKKYLSNCLNCTHGFYTYPSLNQVYCSRLCYLKHRKETGNYANPTKGIKTGIVPKSAFKKGHKSKHIFKGYNSGSKHPNWGKKLEFMKGEKNPNWKGGINKVTKLNRSTNEYWIWRRRVFDRDNYTCQICELYSGYLHADHLKAWKDYPELRYEVSNGRTLCRACHYYITFKRKIPTNSLWGIRQSKEGG